MRYRHLGNSGLDVSEVGLGTNSFGEPDRTGYDEARSIIHEALDCGINFFDTSNVYAQGKSEEFIGRALKGRRHEAIIGTKFGSRRQHGPNLFGGSRKFAMAAVDASLQRLQTDYIDLYMIHRPDTRMPLEETLRALDDLVRSGKVRYIGCCNFEAWRLVDGVWTSRANKWSPLISTQFSYSLLNRSAEKEMLPACRQLGVGVIPYLPLAAGTLTGKVGETGTAPPGSRLGMDRGAASKWITQQNLELVGELTRWARERGKTILELAIAWLLSEPLVGTVIAGASRQGQVNQNAKTVEWRLGSADRAEIEGLFEEHPPSQPDTYYSVAPYFSQPT